MYVCPICSVNPFAKKRTYKNLQALKMHYHAYHMRYCFVCKQHFVDKKRLVKHAYDEILKGDNDHFIMYYFSKDMKYFRLVRNQRIRNILRKYIWKSDKTSVLKKYGFLV